MTATSLILLRRFGLSGMLMLFLVNCQQVPIPSPAEESEALKSLCAKWYESLPTWGDDDTEATKDEIDYSYRVQEALCGKVSER